MRRSNLGIRDPANWSVAQVGRWLETLKLKGIPNNPRERDFHVQHQIDGSVLLTLTENDLKIEPVKLTCLGDIKRIVYGIERLRQKRSILMTAQDEQAVEEDFADVMPEMEDDVPQMMSSFTTDRTFDDTYICANNETNVVLVDPETVESLSKEVATIRLISREQLIRHVESPDTLHKSLVKLALSFFYSSLSFLVTAFVMVLVHDRVPDTKLYPPLPDLILDNVPHIDWAFDMCEYIGLALSVVWFTVLFLHKGRIIIARRMFSLLGTVFLLRCFTMLITSLSVPGMHLQCEARNTTYSEKFVQAFHIWSNLGMSLHGVRSCGDYMFSGHTTVITILCHFITEYTPATWTMLHTTTWVMNSFAVFLILAAHEHYSIDVFIAFYISSRMFLYYHAYAYNHANMTATDDRMRLYYPLGWFFEYGSIGKVDNEFELPFEIPIFWRRVDSIEDQELKTDLALVVPSNRKTSNGSKKEKNKKNSKNKKKKN